MATPGESDSNRQDKRRSS